MPLKFIILLCRSFLIIALSSNFAAAQTAENSQQVIDRINLATITVVGGDVGSTSLGLIRDMGYVLNEGEERRILPMLGLDAVQTISDVLHLRGVDIGLVHEDALQSIGRTEDFPNVKGRLTYVVRLSQDNIYVIAGDTVSDIGQLAGTTVNFGPGVKSEHTTPALLFKALGIDVESVNLSHPDAFKEIREGNIAATVVVGGDLNGLIADLNSSEGLRLLAVPLPEDSEDYAPVTFTNGDVPSLITEGASLDTVSVSLIMIAYNWPTDHPRYDKTSRFIEALFTRFEDFRKPGRHPKWGEINLAAEVPNWTHFPPAKEWIDLELELREEKSAKLEQSFNEFLRSNGNTDISREEWESMYQQFLSWPDNPFEAEIALRNTTIEGIGDKIGTLKMRNTEIMVGGRKEPALLIRPELQGLEPGAYAFHIHENPECGAAQKDGVMVAGHAAGELLWLQDVETEFGPTVATHLGNLPDIVAESDGKVAKNVVAVRLSLADVANRSVVLHDNGDFAVACGIIK